MRAFSVGFAPLQSQVVVNQVDGRAVTGNRYLKQEPYEISCVTLPANPQALAQLALKGLQGQDLLSLTPAVPQEGPTTSPPSPAAPTAARALLARCAMGSLVESRLRYHLGLLG